MDGTGFQGMVHRRGTQVFLGWTDRGGVPQEQLVRAANSQTLQGWVREVSQIFAKTVRTYDFRPGPGVVAGGVEREKDKD